MLGCGPTLLRSLWLDRVGLAKVDITRITHLLKAGLTSLRLAGEVETVRCEVI